MRLDEIEYVVLWLYFLVAPSILLGLTIGFVNIYLKTYFIITFLALSITLIRILKRRSYMKIKNSHLLPSLFLLTTIIVIILFVLYSPLLYNWDAVSLYLPIAKSIIKTGYFVSANVYYGTVQTMYAAPLTPTLLAFFYTVIGDVGFRLVPIFFSILMFVVIYNTIRLFEKRYAYIIATITFFTIVTNPFFIRYYIKDSMYLDLGFITMTFLSIYETIKILLYKNNKEIVPWSMAVALLIISKEYGIYIAVPLFTIVIYSILIEYIKNLNILKVFLILLMCIPYSAIYVWDLLVLGPAIGAISKILGSSILLFISVLLYLLLITKLDKLNSFTMNIKINLIYILVLFTSSLILIPSLFYYVIFAINYGIIGTINLLQIQQKFIPENILSILLPFYLDHWKPPYDIKYMEFFAYDKVFRNIGVFVALGSLLILIVMLFIKRNISRFTLHCYKLATCNKYFSIFILLNLIVLSYYLGAVDISMMLIIEGEEYRRVLLPIAIINVISAMLTILHSERIKEALNIWLLVTIFLHMSTINIMALPISYFNIVSPQKIFVPSDIVLIVLLLSLLLIALSFDRRGILKKQKNETKMLDSLLEKDILFLFLVPITFLFTMLFTWITFISSYSFDVNWYNTIYSAKTYSNSWASQWIETYEFLKSKENATILVEGAYPLAYFLDRPVIVYGNLATNWFTTHSLLVNVNSCIDEIYVVRFRELESSFSVSIFENIVKKLLEENNCTEERHLITVMRIQSFEIYTLKSSR